VIVIVIVMGTHCESKIKQRRRRRLSPGSEGLSVIRPGNGLVELYTTSHHTTSHHITPIAAAAHASQVSPCTVTSTPTALPPATSTRFTLACGISRKSSALPLATQLAPNGSKHTHPSNISR
jgi:hypothetical protein